MLRTQYPSFRKKCHFKPLLVKVALKYLRKRMMLMQCRNSRATKHNIQVGYGEILGFLQGRSTSEHKSTPTKQPTQPDRKFRDFRNSGGGCWLCGSWSHDTFMSVQET